MSPRRHIAPEAVRRREALLSPEDAVRRGSTPASETLSAPRRAPPPFWALADLRTDPADRLAAEEAIRQVYYQTGRDDLLEFLWFESLPAMRLGYSILRHARIPSGSVHRASAILPSPIVQGLLRRAESKRTPVGARTSLKTAFERPLTGLVESCAPLSRPVAPEPALLLAGLAPALAPLRMDGALAASAWRCRTELMSDASAGGDTVLSAYLTAAESCLWWCPFEKVALLCERPLRVSPLGGTVNILWRDGVSVTLASRAPR